MRGAAVDVSAALAGFSAALKNDYPDLEVGLDYQSESGLADSGVLEQDCDELFALAISRRDLAK